MPQVKIALLSTSMLDDCKCPGASNYGLTFINKGLYENGIEGTEFFPLLKNKRGCRSTAKDVAKHLNGSDVPVIAISLGSDSYPMYTRYMSELRELIPDALYVGGGQHFAVEDWYESDSIDQELGSGRMDAAVFGHGQAFIDLCTYLDSGKSGLPKVKAPLGIMYYQGIRSVIMIDSNCPNGCWYCTSKKGRVEVDVREIAYELSTFEAVGENMMINIFDNNRLKTKGKTLEFIRDLRRYGVMSPVSIYFDDSLFAGDGWKNMYRTYSPIERR